MTYSILNVLLLSVILILCTIVVLAIHSYNTGEKHSQATFLLMVSGLICSLILVKSPKYL